MSYFSIRSVRGACTALLTALALGGCGGLQLKPLPMAVYDLGVMADRPLPVALAPMRVQVVAPPWLSASTMQYRLAWQDPDRRRAYAESRWVSAPAEMLGLALSRGLSAGSGGLRCRLRVDLDEFVQVFDSTALARVQLIARVGLLPARGEAPIARTELNIIEDAPSADASGGVSAYRVATGRLVDEVSHWLVVLDESLAPGLNSPGRCGA